MKATPRNLGKGLVGISIILLLLLTAVKLNIDSQSTVLCELTFEAGIDMSECPAHNNPNSWLLMISFGLATAILLAGLYLTFLPKTKSDKSNFKEVDLEELDDDEKKIYHILKESEGSVYQSDLVKKTGFTKVKITRMLDHLEHKEILERKRRGMTNIVVLK